MKINKFGFSLMELIIVVAVVAILAIAGFSVFNPNSRLSDANAVKRAQAETALEEAIKKAIANNLQLPAELASVTSSIPYLLVTEGTATGETYYCSKLGFEIPKVNIASTITPLIGDMPVDPTYENTTSTGYYVYRKGNLFNISSCESTVDCNTCTGDECVGCPVCGNGIVEYSEACDDGNTYKEVCGDGIIQNGTYCYWDCSATSTLNENCEYNNWTQDCFDGGVTWYTQSDAGSGPYCSRTTCQSVSCQESLPEQS